MNASRPPATSATLAAPRRLIVTRPAQDAERWCHDLAARGIPTSGLPLIVIGPAAQPSAVANAWATLQSYQAVMFVSSNAVRYFHASKQASDHIKRRHLATNIRAWAPGPGTAQALVAAGWPAHRVDGPAPQAAQFDSPHLWASVARQIQPGHRVLIVRGEEATAKEDANAAPHKGAAATDSSRKTGAASHGSGRDWLQQQLLQAGAQVDTVAAYRRQPPVLSAAQRKLALEASHDGSVWLFSSSDAVRNLCRAMPGTTWHQALAVATHPRIAATACSAGFGQVTESLPTLDGLCAVYAQLPLG